MRKRIAVFPGDVWFEPDGMPQVVISTKKDPSHGGVVCKTMDAYGKTRHFGEFEMIRHFEYVCDRHGNGKEDFFG